MRRAVLLTVPVLLLLAAPAWSQPPRLDREAAMVRNWYHQFLNRPPDPSGLQFWPDALRSGAPPAEVLAQILDSDEYYARCGYTPPGFVRTLFRDLLGREPTPSEYRQYVAHAAYSRFEVAYTLLRQYPGYW